MHLRDKIRQLNKQHAKFKVLNERFRKKYGGYNIRTDNIEEFRTIVKEHDKVIKLEREVNSLFHKQRRNRR